MPPPLPPPHHPKSPHLDPPQPTLPTAPPRRPSLNPPPPPVRPPWGWAPEAEWGKALCDRRGAGPQKPSGAGPRATAEGLGPRSSSKCGAVVLGGGVCCDYSDDCAAPGGPKFST